MDYFAKLTAKSVLNELPYKPCKLLDFQLLALSTGESFAANSADREIIAVILGGKVTIAAGKEHLLKLMSG